MFPRAPEHTLVNLLRQCYATPRCGSLSASRLISRPTSSRSLHISRAGLSLHLPYTETRQRSQVDRRELLERRKVHTSTNGKPSGQNAGENREYGHELGVIDPAGWIPPDGEKLPEFVMDTEPGYDRIAVLGGGMSGLAAAFFLTNYLPAAKIDIYEASDRLGGWVKSNKIETSKGSIVFEQGPRTLRPHTPAGMSTLYLIHCLGLDDQLLITDRFSDAARNRFIYYPDRLVQMPGPGQDPYGIMWRLFREPIFTGLHKAFMEFIRRPRNSFVEDESVGSFLERRLGGPDIGDNIASAVLHGIYAGDIYKLSAKSLLPKFWAFEKFAGSIMAGFGQTQRFDKVVTGREYNLYEETKGKLRKENPALLDKMKDASVFTFKGGMSALTDALEKNLRENPNVRFKTGEQATKIQFDQSINRIRIKSSKNLPPPVYANAISTIPSRALCAITDKPNTLPSLQGTESVTVMVVNLWYPDPFLLNERGFGYLIPRTIPFEQNPECALGVVFDSDSTKGQDEATGTKLTVMLGGHWWNGLESYPDEAEGKAMAIAVLKRHLKIDVEPEVVNVGLHKNCIPQYTVGHHARMGQAHDEIMEAFGGRLAVTGASYTGVGVNDCIAEARFLVADLSLVGGKDGKLTGQSIVYTRSDVTRRRVEGYLSECTGLEQFQPFDRDFFLGVERGNRKIGVILDERFWKF